MRKICVVGPVPPPMGGDARAVKTLVDSKVFQSEFESFMVNLSDGSLRSSGKDRFTINKIKVVFNAMKNIRSITKHHRIDTFYLTIAQSKLGCLRDIAILFTIYCRKNKGSKVIIHLHGGGFKIFFESSKTLIRKLIRMGYSKVDQAIVLSNSLINMFDGILPKEKIVVVQNCVDDDFLLTQEDIENKLLKQQTQKTFNVIFMSNMILTKGYYELLEAAKQLSTEKTGFRFMFAGPFPSEAAKTAFLDYIASNHLAQTVHYLGVIDGIEKYNLLKDGDIFVLPTYFPPEGQPISIIEAMGAAMPIVTTRQGGIPDMMTDGINGYFVQAKNSDAIVSALKRLVDDLSKFETMAKANRKDVEQKYLEEIYITNMISALK